MALQGSLDIVTHHLIAGWAWDDEAPDVPVSLVLSCDERILVRVLADRHRADLAEAGFGNGRHSFEVRLPEPLSPLLRNLVAGRREEDGAHLGNSPAVLEPASSFDQAAQDFMARVLATTSDEDDLARRLHFLAAQTDRMRQLHADARSGRVERLSRRWQAWSEPGTSPAVAAVAAPPPPRALVIDNRVPLPDHDAASNVVVSHMRALQRLGYAVTFAPVNLHGDGAALVAGGVDCCLFPFYATIEEVLRRLRDSFALVYLHSVATASRYVGLVRDHQPHARIVYSVADLHHLRLTRQAEVEQRPELARHGEHVRLTELTAAWQSDAVITHSTVEAGMLRRHMPAEKICTILWSLAPRPTAVPFAERRGYAFVGCYGHRPNVDAALWLVDHVVPALAAGGRAIPCLLVGSDMPEPLRGLQRHDVEPVGFVPSLSTIFDRVRCTVAPLAFGAGVKGKVLDSLAAGIPCVCSPAAAEGLDLPPALLELVASTPAAMAAAIRRVHDDEALNLACRDAGLAFIAAAMSEESVDRGLRAAAGMATARPG